jgi:hypothetical protein
MPDVSNHLFTIIEREHAHEHATTRRRLIKGTGVALAGAGLLGLAADARPASAAVATRDANSVETILAVAATAEVLATIVNTLGFEKLGSRLDATTTRNVRAAAQQERNHYELLTGPGVGGRAVTTSIHVPDDVFASPEALLTTLVAGEEVIVNAYLIALTVFARQGTLAGSRFARFAGEILAVESVHRALALQSLGQLGNDRSYAKLAQREAVGGLPTTGAPGFYEVTDAVGILESMGFGFGKAGSRPGALYRYAEVAARTPNDPGVNTIAAA